MNYKREVLKMLKERKDRSIWDRGVTQTAVDMLELPDVDWSTQSTIRVSLLNGAETWREYSESGAILVYDADIQERFVPPSRRRINPARMVDMQARACYMACNRIVHAYNNVRRFT